MNGKNVLHTSMHRSIFRSRADRFCQSAAIGCALLLVCGWLAAGENPSGATPTARWWRSYRGADANGPHVLGFWNFDGSGERWVDDASSHRHRTRPTGAKWSANGRFGGCLESDAGHPVSNVSHSVRVHPVTVLYPAGPFSVEMWVKPKAPDSFPATIAPVLIDSKYVPYDHTGLMWSLSRETGGRRQLVVEIGLGDHSQTWYSNPIRLVSQEWQHLAWSYDARGTVTFYHNGSVVGRVRHENAGPMARGTRGLTIGDRQGSLYRGFPGWIDEVRITAGATDFRPVVIEPDRSPIVMRRMTTDRPVRWRIANRTGQQLTSRRLSIRFPGGITVERSLPAVAPGEPADVETPVPSHLRTGRYPIQASLTLKDWPEPGSNYVARQEIPLVITARPLPHSFPVVMWGVGGVANVVREIPRLKQIGFTHCLGLRADYFAIWKDGKQAMPGTEEEIRAARAMLDTALENNIGVIAGLSPGHWLRSAEAGKPFLRIDREGKPYARADVSGLFPRVQQFCYDTGRAMARAYGDHPAFAASLIHTETRGASQVSFHSLELEAFRKATGLEVPSEVRSKRGVDYRKLKDFPADRVIADDDPILQFYRWFWRQGDGWNGLHTKLVAGLKENMKPRDDFWTFYDPAVRVPSIGGSGGRVDVLSHWTYTYPDPIRIGLCTDELLEMARVNRRRQRVMKMTQIIWYRSQTAPPRRAPQTGDSPWVDRDPDAAYITIAPMHLREALWWKLARPIEGIMYHGWQSLVPTESKSAYRLTNDRTRDELRRLIRQVVQPLGPTLKQVPDPPSDVAFLESFTSQMFAGRGTYGWNHSWAGDVYHILMCAKLQPRVLYEESLPADGLAGVRVLVMPDCDVLPRSVVEAVRAFQSAGGIVIGDEETCPAIELDYTLPRYTRTKEAAADKRELQQRSARLREWLHGKYQPYVDSDHPDVVVRCRKYATTDYVFAVNDRRRFGTYVGQYGLVMEDGLPAKGTVRVARNSGYVYSLTERRAVDVSTSSSGLSIACDLGPCEGRVWMITERPIRNVTVDMPKAAKRGESVDIRIAVTDGQRPLDAVIPLRVSILDPEGAVAEYSGYYGAAGGAAAIHFDFASNDRTGVWQVKVQELASGRSAAGYIELSE